MFCEFCTGHSERPDSCRVREDYERLGLTHWRRETSAAEQEVANRDKLTLRHEADCFPNCSIESYLEGVHT